MSESVTEPLPPTVLFCTTAWGFVQPNPFSMGVEIRHLPTGVRLGFHPTVVRRWVYWQGEEGPFLTQEGEDVLWGLESLELEETPLSEAGAFVPEVVVRTLLHAGEQLAAGTLPELLAAIFSNKER